MRPIPAIAVLLACAAVPALAQSGSSTPVSWGGDLGVFAPFESGSSNSFTGRFTADVYWWDRLGVRFAAGFANPTLGDSPSESHADMAYLGGALIDRLTGSATHPYVYGGLGFYHFSGDRSGTDLGLSVGAGFEIDIGLKGAALTPELSAHVISGDGPRFSLALTVGLHSRPR